MLVALSCMTVWYTVLFPDRFEFARVPVTGTLSNRTLVRGHLSRRFLIRTVPEAGGKNNFGFIDAAFRHG
jgi:hypothetical protein